MSPLASRSAPGATWDFGDRLEAVLGLANVLMLAAALFRLPQEFVRQITRHRAVSAAWTSGCAGWRCRAWFAGLPVYGSLEHADYPPASYAILWPALGWLDLAGRALVLGRLHGGGAGRRAASNL